MPKSLYDRDFNCWLEETIARLKEHQFESSDIEHLIEEITDLGKSEKNTLESIKLNSNLQLEIAATQTKPTYVGSVGWVNFAHPTYLKGLCLNIFFNAEKRKGNAKFRRVFKFI